MAISADSHQLWANSRDNAIGSPSNNINDPMIPAKTRNTILVPLLLAQDEQFIYL
jgi:hypothetical protein